MLSQKVQIIENAKELIIVANGTKFRFLRNESFEKLVDVFHELQIDDVDYGD